MENERITAAAESAAETAAPVKRTRRTSKKTVDAAASSNAENSPTRSEPQAEPAPAKPKRSRAKKAAAETADAGQSAASDSEAPASEDVAAKPTRKRASRKKAETATKNEAVQDELDLAQAASQPETAGEPQAEPATKPKRSRSTKKAQESGDESATAPEHAAPEPAAPATEHLDPFAAPALNLLFQSPDLSISAPAKPEESQPEAEPAEGAVDSKPRKRSRSKKAKSEATEATEEAAEESISSHRRRRRRRGDSDLELSGGNDDDPPNTVTRVRAPRAVSDTGSDRVASVKGSTRLEAKRQRRRETREGRPRRQVITEAEFLARRESVDRVMVVRQRDDRIQIGVLEDGVLAEHFVSRTQQDSLIGNVYLGKVQNVLPSMEAAFVDIGRGRNAVLYAGEVDWEAAKLNGAPRRIENALKSGDNVLVQVTKDPVGHKGARLTSQVSLPGRYLVYVPGGSMTGISRKLPDVERNRLKRILKENLPENAGVIVRTAAEGASEQELGNDINRLRAQWEGIQEQAASTKTLAPELLYAEPDLTIKVVRDVFNEDFSKLVISGELAWDTVEAYVTYVAPDLLDRLEKWEQNEDIFGSYRITEQINKALERKVFLPSGGSLVIDRTEAMTVVDVNTGKFTGSGGNLEETVTKNNLEAAEEVVRQLRLRDIGGIIVIDFIDMVLESNRDLVLRRLVECLGRDRTKHQVAEVTSLGLVQMTRKRMGTGLLEVFGEQCELCHGRGMVTHEEPVEHRRHTNDFHGRDNSKKETRNDGGRPSRSERRKSRQKNSESAAAAPLEEENEQDRAQKAEVARNALANIAAAAMAAHHEPDDRDGERAVDMAEEAAETSTGAVLTFGEDTVELPNGGKRSDEPATQALKPDMDLDKLSDVFNHLGGGEHTPEQPVASNAAPVASSSSRRPRRHRAAGRAQGAANSTAVQPIGGSAQGAVVQGAVVQAEAKTSVATPPPTAQAEPAESLILGVGVPASQL